VKEAANLLANFVYNNIRKLSMIPGISHFIVGGKDSAGFHLYDLSPDGSIVEVDDYISSGSGSVMAFGVLETLYKKGLSVDEGVKLAAKGVNAAVQRDIASGNGIDIVSITKEGIKKVFSKEFELKIEV
jgi:proteasome beta subunit